MWMSPFTNTWMAPSPLAMAHTQSVVIAPRANGLSRHRRGTRQERGIGFRSAQNAPPYGLRWASLQPTPLSCRKESERQKNRGTNTFPVTVVVVNELCGELRPTRVLQKPAIFTCYGQWQSPKVAKSQMAKSQSAKVRRRFLNSGKRDVIAAEKSGLVVTYATYALLSPAGTVAGEDLRFAGTRL